MGKPSKGKRGQPLDGEERDKIEDGLARNHTYGQIAKNIGRATSTVARYAKSIGHQVQHSNLARVRNANETRKAYGAELRAARLVKISQRVDRILDRMGEPHRRYHFGGKENTLNFVDLEEPDSDMLRQYASSIAQLTRAEMEIVKHDERGDDAGSDFDRWLEQMTGV